ncbi:GNAT family N-acetyltransferase [Colwellia psychrerythraea]|uniref:Phosphinothricin acetyltransferase n=1 Tax=Colwellia psychrerythraea TaxID=28229 RepID=A0A099KU42_COLPS|nr:GNAT family N-acetyltransferase [Colwellia psychrerythraea]KGJ93695.1 Phosphinothricin acetyltransferase [Colwellia psychrerythraea]
MKLETNLMIRAVQVEDANRISAIYNHYIVHTVVTFEEEVITASEITKRIGKITADGLPWFVAEDRAGNILGYAYAAKWRDRFSYRFSVEVTVYLDPKYISKGLGTKLYQVLFDELKGKNIHSAIGGITLPNEGSVALHEKFGMIKVAHFNEVGWKFNRWLDVGYWQVTI